MLRHLLVAGVLVWAVEGLLAQPFVRGTVRDMNHAPLPFCNVFTQREGVPLQITSTDESGVYQLDRPDSDSCELIITSIGYKRFTAKITGGGSAIIVDAVLEPDTVSLDQVIVHGESPIQTRGDTVVYDAAYFANGNEVALADLLKKLPGLSVDDKGKVRFQGKEVKKVKVEGDDLFESNYALLTKNLSADLVEHVEVLQNYSDNPLLKNIENSEEVAINLTLREDRRKTFFGDIRGGSNFTDRYEGKVNLVSFLSRTKLYALGNLNNIGTDPTGDVEELQRGSTQATHAVGDGVGSEYLVPVSKPYLAEFRRDRYYFNQASFGSLNGIFRPSKAVSIKLTGYLYHDRNSFNAANTTDYFTPTDTAAFREFQTSLNREQLSHVQGTVTYQLSPQMNMTYRGGVTRTEGAVEQESLLNLNGVRKNLVHDALRQDHHLNVTRKLNEQSAVSFDLRYLNDARPQQFFSDGNLVSGYFPSTPSSDSLYQENDLPTEFFGSEVNYFHRFKSGKLGARAGYKQTRQRLESHLHYVSTDLSWNDVESWNQEGYGELYYSWRKGDVTVTPAASYQALRIELSDRPAPSLHYFNPRLGVRWQINSRSNVSAIYVRGNSPSSTSQLARNPLLRDYNQLILGDDQFRSFRKDTYLVNYQFGDWSSRFSLFATIFHQDLPQDYLANVEIEPNYTVTTTNQLADRRLSSFNLTMDRFFKSFHSNLKLDWKASRAEFVTSTEGVTARTVSHTHTVDISLRSSFPGAVNAHVGHVMQASFNESDLIKASNYSSLLYIDGYVTGLKHRLNITAHVERYELISVESRPTFYFVDIFARYRFKEGGPLLVFLNARNLLNETVYAQRFVSPQGISTNTNQLIPRYLLVGVEFKL